MQANLKTPQSKIYITLVVTILNICFAIVTAINLYERYKAVTDPTSFDINALNLSFLLFYFPTVTIISIILLIVNFLDNIIPKHDNNINHKRLSRLKILIYILNLVLPLVYFYFFFSLKN